MVVGFTTDAARVMGKFIRSLPIEIIHQECFAHGIHLAVCDVLYKKKENDIENENDMDIEVEVEIEVENDDDDIANDVEVNIDVDIEPELNQNLGEIIKKIRKVVKKFRQSPVKNDTHLQPLIVQSFGKELKLNLDVVTRWNSLLSMLERFYKLRREIQMACISAELEFPLSDADLTKVNEVCEALNPVKFAIEMLSKNEADLLYADQMLQFVIQELSDQNSEIAQEIKEAFIKRVLARRLNKVVHLMEYLENPRFIEQNQDNFKQKIVKSDISKLATSLITRLFPTSATQDEVKVEATN